MPHAPRPARFRALTSALLACLLALPLPALPQQADPAAHAGHDGHAGHAMHGQHAPDAMAAAPSTQAAEAVDARQAVTFPAALRRHTLANMRDHLLALGQIQTALARADFDAAADTAEQRLGMSSMASHGAHEVAGYMPRGMQEAGLAMHRAASRFATAAKDASVSGDVRAALAALTPVTEACVACHAGYRLD